MKVDKTSIKEKRNTRHKGRREGLKVMSFTMKTENVYIKDKGYGTKKKRK